MGGWSACIRELNLHPGDYEHAKHSIRGVLRFLLSECLEFDIAALPIIMDDCSWRLIFDDGDEHTPISVDVIIRATVDHSATTTLELDGIWDGHENISVQAD